MRMPFPVPAFWWGQPGHEILGLRGADFAPQEYLVAFRPDTLVLIGRDWEDTPAHRAEDGRTTGGESLADTRPV